MVFATEHGHDLVMDKLQKLADDTGIDGVYKQAYDFAEGFIEGASFSGNKACQTSLTGIVYNALGVYEFRQAYIIKNLVPFGISSQKLSQNLNLFNM